MSDTLRLARNETLVQVTAKHLEDRRGADAVRAAVLDAIGDPGAHVCLLLRGCGEHFEDDRVTVTQARARWWAWLPQELANVLDHDLFGFTQADRDEVLAAVGAGLCCATLAWHEGEPEESGGD